MDTLIVKQTKMARFFKHLSMILNFSLTSISIEFNNSFVMHQVLKKSMGVIVFGLSLHLYDLGSNLIYYENFSLETL